MKKLKLGIIAAVIIVAVVIIIVAVMGSDRNGIIEQYYALTNKPENSARQFRIPFGYITVNSDGTINIEFATSTSTISNDINVGDDSTDVASGDDDRQNGTGTGTGTGNGNDSNNSQSPGTGDNNQNPGESNPTPAPPPNPNLPGGYTQEDIEADISNGLYTLEDFSYLVALAGESGSYDGFYAVASSVRNRVNSPRYVGNTYKAIITAANQYTGYSSSRVANPYNASTDVIRAAVDILRGGESSVGSCCSFFSYDRSYNYDIWAEAGVEFYNWGGNIFHNGGVHNHVLNKTAGAVIIWDHVTRTYIYPSGTKGP